MSRLAQELGRRHKDVLEVRDKAVEDLGDLGPAVYPLGSYLDRQNQKRHQRRWRDAANWPYAWCGTGRDDDAVQPGTYGWRSGEEPRNGEAAHGKRGLCASNRIGR